MVRFKKKSKGWYGEPIKHAKAAKGIPTKTERIPRVQRMPPGKVDSNFGKEKSEIVYEEGPGGQLHPEKATLVYMPPHRYLNEYSKRTGLTPEQVEKRVDRERIESIKRDALMGRKIEAANIDDTGDRSYGIHRAIAAQELGADVIPVVHYDKLSNKELRKVKGKKHKIRWEY